MKTTSTSSRASRGIKVGFVAPTRKMMHEGCEDGAHLVRLPFCIFFATMWFVFKEGSKSVLVDE
jgi:hypothetical protein